MELLENFVYAVGSVVCHQLPERSFFWGDRQFPVCARCTGLYLSGFIGLAGWFAVKASRGWRRLDVDPPVALRLVVIAALPTLLSLATAAAGGWDGTNWTRAALAVPLGVTAGAIVAAVTTKDLR